MSVTSGEEKRMRNSEDIWHLVDAKKDDFIALSDRVWGMPELLSAVLMIPRLPK